MEETAALFDGEDQPLNLITTGGDRLRARRTFVSLPDDHSVYPDQMRNTTRSKNDTGSHPAQAFPQAI